MKYTIETELDAPIDDVAELVGDSERWEEWLEGLERVEHVSGSPGMEGARFRLTFETGGTTIEMRGTVIERNLPDVYCQTMEAPHVTVTVTTRLVPLSPDTTKHVSEQEYAFVGLKNRVIGRLMRRTFENQTRRHVKNFKRLVEA